MGCCGAKQTQTVEKPTVTAEDILKMIEQSQQNSDSHVEKNKDGYFNEEELKQCSELKPSEILQNHPKEIQWQNSHEKLGQGGSGIVYKGLLKKNGMIIAAKQVYLGDQNKNGIQPKIESFEKEIEILKQLEHENIVRYYGVKHNKDSIDLIMEYVAGGSISSLLSKYGKFKECLIQKYIKQTLNGLEYLHSNGVIHRDIKGGNILVDKEGICKLSDFGSSKKLNIILDKEKFKTLVGTVNWMAPEVIKQSGHGRFADIWSLGCTIIEMATGKPPWSEIPDQNYLYKMLFIGNSQKPPRFPDELSNNGKSFLKKCLQINPKDRWNVKKLKEHPWIRDFKEGFDQEQNFGPQIIINIPKQSGRQVNVQKFQINDEEGSNQQINHQIVSSFQIVGYQIPEKDAIESESESNDAERFQINENSRNDIFQQGELSRPTNRDSITINQQIP